MADAFDAAWDISKEDEMVSIRVPKGMVRLIETIMANPDMYLDVGYDGTMAGHYGGYTMRRPKMEGMFDSLYDDAEPVGPDFTGDYYGDDGEIRGNLSKLKLLDALRRMGLS